MADSSNSWSASNDTICMHVCVINVCMYVYVCVCVFVCIWMCAWSLSFVCMYVWMSCMYVFLCIYGKLQMQGMPYARLIVSLVSAYRLYSYMYVRRNACMRVWMYACMHICMHACMHVCMYACVCVCVVCEWCMLVSKYVYIHTYIYIYIHTHGCDMFSKFACTQNTHAYIYNVCVHTSFSPSQIEQKQKPRATWAVKRNMDMKVPMRIPVRVCVVYLGLYCVCVSLFVCMHASMCFSIAGKHRHVGPYTMRM
jgi:hypothetical protein